MKKFINFAKRELLIISSAIFMAFIVLMIVISCLPKGKKYYYEFSVLGISMEVSYTFSGDEVVMDTTLLGSHSTEKTKYKITKGELYFLDLESGEWEFAGEINAYEITMKANAEETGMGNMEIEMECKANKNIRIISIVGMAVFGLIACGCVTLFVLDKKGSLKFLKSTNIFDEPGGEYVSLTKDEYNEVEDNAETLLNEENMEEVKDLDKDDNVNEDKYTAEENTEKTK